LGIIQNIVFSHQVISMINYKKIPDAAYSIVSGFFSYVQKAKKEWILGVVKWKNQVLLNFRKEV